MNPLKFLPQNVTLDKKQEEVLGKIDLILTNSTSSSLLQFFKNNKIKHGIYLQGTVGSGKTMLMESFYQATGGKKHLVHYQDFIQKLHQDIHLIGPQDGRNILGKIAKKYAKLTNYIFLDEFEIKDITDAMMIGSLFREFINNKLFIFLTTNSMPDDLYKDGLQRESFLPFIEMVKQEFEVISLNSDHDYRMREYGTHKDRIFYPINAANQNKLDKIIDDLTGNDVKPSSIEVFGRKITFQNTHEDILVTNFEELFMQDFSYIDYIHIVQNFKTIVVKDMRQIDPLSTNLAVRFINFVDNAYFYKVILFMNLACPVDKIYENGARTSEFKRTISRLHEMSNA
jgi:cell division protein ZapE